MHLSYCFCQRTAGRESISTGAECDAFLTSDSDSEEKLGSVEGEEFLTSEDEPMDCDGDGCATSDDASATESNDANKDGDQCITSSSDADDEFATSGSSDCDTKSADPERLGVKVHNANGAGSTQSAAVCRRDYPPNRRPTYSIIVLGTPVCVHAAKTLCGIGSSRLERIRLGLPDRRCGPRLQIADGANRLAAAGNSVLRFLWVLYYTQAEPMPNQFTFNLPDLPTGQRAIEDQNVTSDNGPHDFDPDCVATEEMEHEDERAIATAAMVFGTPPFPDDTARHQSKTGGDMLEHAPTERLSLIS